MKIAIFHNFMDNIGGAEIVDLILARELQADIFTTNIDKDKIKKMGFGSDNIYSIGRIPLNAPWRQEAAYWRFKNLNLGNKYDFYIIAGDWAMSGALHNKPNLWYVYSPMREIFDLYEYTRKHTVPKWKRPFFDVWVKGRRYLIKKDVKNINNIVSISKNIQNRVKEYLDRDSAVIYPPTEIDKFYYNESGDFWLSVNRLINHKRLEIQLEAFRQLPDEKLVIVGSYESASHFRHYAGHIIKNKPDNVEIRSWVDNKELIDLYANCQGFIATSLNEDYGMNVVEAMASGKPVIAPNEGGYKETIISGETGILIDNIDSNKLISAIRSIGQNTDKYREACRKRAEQFDMKMFIADISGVINANV